MRRFLVALGLCGIAACGRGETIALGGDASFVFDAEPSDRAIVDQAEPFPDVEIIDEGVPLRPDGDIVDEGVGNPDGEPGPDLAPAIDGSAEPDATPLTDGGAIIDGGSPSDTGVNDATAGRDTGTAADASMTPDAGLCQNNRDCGFGRVCDPSTGQCLECLTDTDCGPGRACDTVHGFTCQIQCRTGRCFGGQVCDMNQNLCVDCLASTDCNAGQVCDTGRATCVECISNMDCANHVGTPFCDASNACVGCRSDADCQSTQTCDPSFHACVTTGTRGLCEPCNADDQCGGAADLCIGTITGGGFQDRSCAIDCTNLTCPAGFDCVSVRGGSAQQCRPSYAMQQPSCTAIRNLGSACVFNASNQDPGCGIQNRQDAQCVLDASGGGVCTVWCNQQSDCPMGFTCTQSGPGQTGLCL
ncbi:MAG: hypothetical protein U1E65_36605 [Myxococcota bacterium]